MAIVMADWSFKGGYTRKDEDFEEKDVWSVIERDDDDSLSSLQSLEIVIKILLHGAVSPKPHREKIISNDNKVVVPAVPRPHHQSSAPVNIPDWSKIYGNGENLNNGTSYDDDGHGHGHDDDDDGDGMVVPPHEWIARRLARSQISSFSVCEGVGRTLKGRDLSRVRNAILTKTGFLE
ncbi:uncharacterized protein [Rutidosis leptorrhynchoides]|uniref:uncharacterized protein n=1 Tax=Rutidosis leptorrhynchoides TaxID=125765 RepID=UPI003A99B292